MVGEEAEHELKQRVFRQENPLF